MPAPRRRNPEVNPKCPGPPPKPKPKPLGPLGGKPQPGPGASCSVCSVASPSAGTGAASACAVCSVASPSAGAGTAAAAACSCSVAGPSAGAAGAAAAAAAAAEDEEPITLLKPVAVAATTEIEMAQPAEPLTVDETLPVRFSERLLGRLTQTERSKLGCWLAAGAFGSAPAFNVGTMCSGTDAPVLATQAVCRTLPHLSTAHHTFSAESDVNKQRFLQRMFPDLTPKSLFVDVRDMVFGSAATVAGSHEAVPSCEVLFAGFPCTDVSALNSNKQEHRSIIASAGRSTGSCFEAIIGHVQRHRHVAMVILENVLGLAQPPPLESTNYAACVRRLRSEGFLVTAWTLCPTLFGVPQQRNRIWFLALRADRLNSDTAADVAVETVLQGLMSRFVGHPMIPLDEFLLDETHLAVQRHYAKLSDEAEAGRPKKRPKGIEAQTETVPQWVERHLEVGIQTRQRQAEVRAATGAAADMNMKNHELKLQLFPGLRELNPRHWSQLRCLGLCVPSCEVPCLIDLSQMVDRSAVHVGKIGCFTPAGFVFHTGRCRRILGNEGLRLQGILWPAALEDRLLEFSDRLLASLAGNAFQMHCCIATFVAGLVASAVFAKERV